MYEIEAKVAISKSEYERLKKEISKFSKFIGKIKKEDEYYNNPKIAYLRTRKLSNKAIFDIKIKNVKHGIESNVELEWGIRNINKFQLLLKKIGIVSSVKKSKISEVYKYKNFTIELNYLRRLGYFMEIECLIQKKEQIPKCKRELINLFKTLGFNSRQFEKKYYLDLLKEKALV